MEGTEPAAPSARSDRSCVRARTGAEDGHSASERHVGDAGSRPGRLARVGGAAGVSVGQLGSVGTARRACRPERGTR